MIDLSWNSSRLEGNTYSPLDTQWLIEHGEAAEGHDARETQMVLNHKAAINLLVLRAEHVGFNRYTILNLHALLAENLLADSRAWGNLPLIRRNLCPLSFVDVPTQAYVDGLLGVYELNRIELLRDVFCWAYEHSCARCSVLRQSLGEPDPFRLRHRALIAETIRDVVIRRMGRKAGWR